MKRPILIVVIAYIVGIIWGLYFKSIISFYILCVILSCLCHFIFSYFKLKRYIKVFLKYEGIILFLFVVTLSYVVIRIKNVRYDTLYQDKQEGEFIGTIVSDGIEKEYKIVYKIRVDKIIGDTKKCKGTYLLLNIKKEDEKLHLQYGDKVKFYGQYIEPTSSRNYKGFNYQNYLKSIKVYGTVNGSKLKVIKENDISFISRISYLARDMIKEKINQLLPNNTGNVLIGILIGDKNQIDNTIIESFKSSNLYHILAVSGAHISYIVLGVFILFNKFFSNKKLVNILIILVLLFFTCITGFSPSVVRAVIMGSLLLVAQVFYRKPDIINSISFSLLLILIYNPFTIYNIGLWLSYGGTVGIIFFYKKIRNCLSKKKSIPENQLVLNKTNQWWNKLKKSIIDMFCVTVSAQIIIFPIMILNFNTLSLTFFVSNILVGYLMGTITIFGFLLIIISIFIPFLAKLLSIPFQFILQLLLFISRSCSQLPLSKIYVITPKVFFIILYYFFLLFFDYYFTLFHKNNLRITEQKILNLFSRITNTLKKKLISIIILFLIICVICYLFTFIPQTLKIYFIDVGQGDSTLIITPTKKRILMDGGGSPLESSFDVGEQILVPYLLNRGIKTIDYIMISHFDADHVRSE